MTLWFPHYVIAGCVKRILGAHFRQLLGSSHLVFESCPANQLAISPVNLFGEASAGVVARRSHINVTIPSLLRFKWARLMNQKSTGPKRKFTPIQKSRGWTSSPICRTRPWKCPHTRFPATQLRSPGRNPRNPIQILVHTWRMWAIRRQLTPFG